MEVHHHSHPSTSSGHRKKWTHYLWEFFMLFLAVSLGFLVENLREHRIEKKREKALMKALLLDLNADIAQIDSLALRRDLRNTHCDSLIFMLSTGAKKSRSLLYFYGRNASRRIHFRPQDGTLLQLRNSGGFRVVHNNTVLNSINTYELGLKYNKENIDVEEKELTEYTAIASRVFDVRVFQEMTRNNIVEKPVNNTALINENKLLLNELAIKLHYWKRTSLSVLESWKALRAIATVLINDIQKEYHLE